jgi:hypothetical protein
LECSCAMGEPSRTACRAQLPCTFNLDITIREIALAAVVAADLDPGVKPTAAFLHVAGRRALVPDAADVQDACRAAGAGAAGQ